MSIHVRAVHLDLTDAIEGYAQSRFAFTNERFGQLVREVTIRLMDNNGPKHGHADRVCKVMATLRNSTQVVIEQVSNDLYSSIDLAAGRLKQVLSRQINRLPSSHRRHRMSASGQFHYQ